MTEVEFCGERFRVTDPGHYAMRDFQRLASTVDTDDAAAAGSLDAVSDFVAACLEPEDVARWEAAARRGKATTEQMLTVVMEALAARPTARPSDSSGGPQSTTTSFEVGSSSPANNRPDLALVRMQEQQYRTG